MILATVAMGFSAILPPIQTIPVPKPVEVQAHAGPTKSGMYVMEVECPSNDSANRLVVLQENAEGEKRRSVASFADSNSPKLLKVEVADPGQPFEEAFPKGNDWSPDQLDIVSRGGTKFLRAIYGVACVGDEQTRVQFFEDVAANRALLGKTK